MNKVEKYYSGLWNKVGANLVTAGSKLVMTVVLSSFMKFYTDVIGLNGAVYATVYLVFSIWNGINDPLIGLWADKASFVEGKGKYKRLIRKSIPLFALPVIMLLFAQPTWSQTLLAIYLLVLMVAYEAGQTLLNVSFNSFKINTFVSSSERTKMQTIGTYVEMVPVFAAGAIPMIFLTGDFSNTTIIVVFTAAILLGAALVLIGNRFVKEDKHFYDRLEITNGLKELLSFFKVFIKDKAFLIFIIGMGLINIATGNYFVGYLYYMDNVLLVSGAKVVVPDVLTGIAQMAILPLIVIWVKKYGTKNVISVGLLISVVGHFLLTFNFGYWVVAPLYVIILAGYAFASATMIPLQGLLVDHFEIKTGKRQPGVLGGIFQMIFLPAASAQVLIIGAFLSSSGYDGAVKVQAPEVVNAIRLSTGLIPAVLLLVGIIVLSFMPLGKKQEDQLKDAIEDRRKS